MMNAGEYSKETVGQVGRQEGISGSELIWVLLGEYHLIPGCGRNLHGINSVKCRLLDLQSLIEPLL